MTELERQIRQELEHTIEAYLGFMQSGMQTTADGAAIVVIHREDTIAAFCRIHPVPDGMRHALLEQYTNASPVSVRREWWNMVRRSP